MVLVVPSLQVELAYIHAANAIQANEHLDCLRSRQRPEKVHPMNSNSAEAANKLFESPTEKHMATVAHWATDWARACI